MRLLLGKLACGLAAGGLWATEPQGGPGAVSLEGAVEPGFRKLEFSLETDLAEQLPRRGGSGPGVVLFKSIVVGGGRYVGVGTGSSERSVVATSADGRKWDARGIMVGLHALAYGRGKFVAVGDCGAVAVSSDGAAWKITSITTNELVAVSFAKGVFTATERSGATHVSADGFLWRGAESAPALARLGAPREAGGAPRIFQANKKE